MAVSDPIADLFTSIRNAVQAQKGSLTVPFSRVKKDILSVLMVYKYIEGFEVKEHKNNKKSLEIFLRYENGKPVFSELKRVSKPGRRVYVAANKIPLIKRGIGIALLTTPQGVICDKTARKENVGGEFIGFIW